MRTLARLSVIFPLALALAACGGEPAEDAANEPATDSAAAPAAPSSEVAAAPAAGEKPASFAVCSTCHAVEAGKNGVGPSLAGVVGRKAGTLAGFAYSEALKNSGKTWDEASLDAFLAAPTKDVPGTRMVNAIPDAAKRKEVIDYLKTLK